MKTIAMCALALLLTSGAASAEGLSISVSSEDPNTEMGPRYETRDARLAITSRDGSVVLMLMDDLVAVQLSDKALAAMETKKKKETGFLEDLLVAGVKLAVGKSVEYPIAHIRSIDVRNGLLQLTNDQNKPVFSDLKVNGKDVLRDFSSADAARFVSAFRAKKH
jgi:hypothetical protein